MDTPFPYTTLFRAADGFRVGYATDFNILTDDMRALYQKLEVWILDCLRVRPHPTHPDLATALEWIAQLAPKRAIFIHMDQSMDYRTLRDRKSTRLNSSH